MYEYVGQYYFMTGIVCLVIGLALGFAAGIHYGRRH
mgnify:CR=1 FL=1